MAMRVGQLLQRDHPQPQKKWNLSIAAFRDTFCGFNKRVLHDVGRVNAGFEPTINAESNDFDQTVTAMMKQFPQRFAITCIGPLHPGFSFLRPSRSLLRDTEYVSRIGLPTIQHRPWDFTRAFCPIRHRENERFREFTAKPQFLHEFQHPKLNYVRDFCIRGQNTLPVFHPESRSFRITSVARQFQCRISNGTTQSVD